jgi:tetratricopeptide (TPR) repeat protein
MDRLRWSRSVAVFAWAVATMACEAQPPQDRPDPGRQAYEALAAGDLATAEARFRAALAANPKDIASHVGLGQVLSRLAKPREAADAQRKAVALNPTSPDLRIGLSAHLESAGDATSSLVELGVASRHAPTDPRVWIALAGTLRRAGRLPEARRACSVAVGLAPDAPAVIQECAETAEAGRDFGLAAAYYETLVRVQPASRPARMAHLGALSNAGRHDQVRRIAVAMLTGAPDDSDARMSLASALDGLGERDAAIAEYRKVLAAAPTLATAWGNLGWTQYQAGKLDDAAQSSRKALELDPALAYVRYNLGLILATKGDAEAARQAYGAALEAGDASDLRAAIADLEAALARKPDDATLKEALAMLKAGSTRRR